MNDFEHQTSHNSEPGLAIGIRTIKAGKTELLINASIPGQFLAVGMAKFVVGPQGLYCDIVQVEPHARRKLVATALHDFAEQHFGLSLTASKTLTSEGAAFLKNRGVEIPGDVKIQSWEEWFGSGESATDCDGDELAEVPTP